MQASSAAAASAAAAADAAGLPLSLEEYDALALQAQHNFLKWTDIYRILLSVDLLQLPYRSKPVENPLSTPNAMSPTLCDADTREFAGGELFIFAKNFRYFRQDGLEWKRKPASGPNGNRGVSRQLADVFAGEAHVL